MIINIIDKVKDNVHMVDFFSKLKLLLSTVQ